MILPNEIKGGVQNSAGSWNQNKRIQETDGAGRTIA
jgi:hypothetical protein